MRHIELTYSRVIHERTPYGILHTTLVNDVFTSSGKWATGTRVRSKLNTSREGTIIGVANDNARATVVQFDDRKTPSRVMRNRIERI